jgi:hypothetical protein
MIIQMIINDVEYEVVVNPPMVELAKISQPMMAGFLVNPTKLEVGIPGQPFTNRTIFI